MPATNDKLVWQLTNISVGNKYRFKQYHHLYEQGEVWPSATKPLPENVFLEIQIAYDKAVKDFYLKSSLHKISFTNNKGEKKYFFELSDIIVWGCYHQWVSYKELEKIKATICQKNFSFLEEIDTIKRKPPQISNFFHHFNFHKVPIIKPSYISDLIKKDFLEIKIDYRQKASGQQAMLFYNIGINNLTKNNKSVVNDLVKKKDILVFIIDKTKFRKIFLPLIFLFAQLSNNHWQDMKTIIETLLSTYQSKKSNKNSS